MFWIGVNELVTRLSIHIGSLKISLTDIHGKLRQQGSDTPIALATAIARGIAGGFLFPAGTGGVVIR